MTNFLKIAEGIDVVPLQLALARQPELFDRYSERRTAPGSPHSQMTDIWLRYNDRRTADASGDFSKINDRHESVWYPDAARLPEAVDLAFQVMALARGEQLGGILITKLPAGGVIEPHTDAGWHAATYDKFYLAVQTPPNALFKFPDGDIHARDGDLWWFRNDVTHAVTNGGPGDRIAMVVCVKTFRGPAW